MFRGFVAARARPHRRVASRPSSACRTASRWARSASCGSPEQRAEWLPKFAQRRVARRVRAHRAALGLRLRAGPAHHRDARRRRVGAQRRQALDRQRHVLATSPSSGRRTPRTARSRASSCRPRRPATRPPRSRTSRRCASCRTPTSRSTTSCVPEANRLQNANSFRDTAAVLRLTRAEVAWAAVGNSIGAYEAAVKYARRARAVRQDRSARTSSSRTCSRRCLGNITASHRHGACASREMLDEGEPARRALRARQGVHDGRMRETVAWAARAAAATASCSTTTSPGYFADAEAIYSYEGTREMNTLIVGRASRARPRSSEYPGAPVPGRRRAGDGCRGRQPRGIRHLPATRPRDSLGAMTTGRRRTLIGAYATFALFTVLAGQFWRNLLGWWGFAAVAARRRRRRGRAPRRRASRLAMAPRAEVDHRVPPHRGALARLVVLPGRDPARTRDHALRRPSSRSPSCSASPGRGSCAPSAARSSGSSPSPSCSSSGSRSSCGSPSRRTSPTTAATRRRRSTGRAACSSHGGPIEGIVGNRNLLGMVALLGADRLRLAARGAAACGARRASAGSSSPARSCSSRARRP